MSTKTLTCHIAVCDDCGGSYEDDCIPHWPTPGEAIDDACDGGDWWATDETLLCYGCTQKPHDFVASEANTDHCGRCPHPAEEHTEAPAVTR